MKKFFDNLNEVKDYMRIAQLNIKGFRGIEYGLVNFYSALSITWIK